MITRSCSLDINKYFSIATTLSISGEKQQQLFEKNDDGILALKIWVTSEKCGVIVCEATSDF
jgi:ferritin-like protein